MTEHYGDYAEVHVAPSGVSVSVKKATNIGPTTDVAAFSWVDGVDVEQWAIDYAAAINRAAIERNDGAQP